MPVSRAIFAAIATNLLGTVTDLKHMARYSNYLRNDNLGLKKLEELLQVDRIGIAHFVGSDNLLTTSIYAKMRVIINVNQSYMKAFYMDYHIQFKVFDDQL